MAERRMVSKGIIRQDKFLDLTLGAQALYMHLLAEADDEGFVGNPKRIRLMVGASDKDLKRLYESGYVKEFDSGVAYITDWHLQNVIRKDRAKSTIYTKEKNQLFGNQTDNQIDNQTDNQTDNQMSAQYSIEKNSTKKKKEKSVDGALSPDEVTALINNACVKGSAKGLPFPTQNEIYAFIKANNIKKVNSFRFFAYYNARGWRNNGSPITDWQTLITLWENNNGEPE